MSIVPDDLLCARARTATSGIGSGGLGGRQSRTVKFEGTENWGPLEFWKLRTMDTLAVESRRRNKIRTWREVSGLAAETRRTYDSRRGVKYIHFLVWHLFRY